MLDEIYQKFITDILPKIQEGLVITKDYFTDLFGRYVKYLIVVDSLSVIGLLIFFIVVWFVAKRLHPWVMKETEGALYVLYVFLLIPFLFLLVSVDKLAKDIFIPEIRVYQELKGFVPNK